MILRAGALAVALILLAAVGQVGLRAVRGEALWRGSSPSLGMAAAAAHEGRPGERSWFAALVEPCGANADFTRAAALNAASRDASPVVLFRRAELGWTVYEPLAGRELQTSCPAGSGGFAQALASWQAAHRLPASGVMDAPTLEAMKAVWMSRRPFVAASAHGVCPAPPGPGELASTSPSEGYGGKPVLLRPEALNAYRTMVSAARSEAPSLAADRRLLTIFSGYRDPVANTARCLLQGDCDGAGRASCSAHGTGLAMDLYLGAAPGYPPESTADANRLFQSRTPAYLWMVANASRFGFVNYPFEPWHWEWAGEPA